MAPPGWTRARLPPPSRGRAQSYSQRARRALPRWRKRGGRGWTCGQAATSANADADEATGAVSGEGGELPGHDLARRGVDVSRRRGGRDVGRELTAHGAAGSELGRGLAGQPGGDGVAHRVHTRL